MEALAATMIGGIIQVNCKAMRQKKIGISTAGVLATAER
jgi:hypothetical protein